MSRFERATLFALFLFISCLYILNLSRSVYGGDVGDLVTSAAVWGVAHPPGYPLFTLVGGILIRFFSVFNFSPVYSVGLISAVSGSLGIVFFYLASLRISKNRLSSLIGSLVLAFSYPYWFYAEIAEVFALNSFFVILLIYLSLLYRDTGKKVVLYLLSFFAGLSLTNHHTIILIFPTLLLLCSSIFGEIKRDPLMVLKLAGLGLLGFSIYLYVIVASTLHPIIDWGVITSPRAFFDLVTRAVYGTFTLGHFTVETPISRLIVLKAYFTTFITQSSLPVFLLSIVGMIVSIRKNRMQSFALLLGICISGPLFIAYSGFPLNNTFFFGIYERFLTMSFIIFILFFPQGLFSFTSIITRFFTNKGFQILFISIFFLIPIQLFFYNYPKTNLHDVTIGDDLGTNYLKPLPKNAILYLTGDTNYFNTQYVRYALGVREDVLLLGGGNISFSNSILYNDLSLRGKIPDKKQAELMARKIKEIDSIRPVYSDTKYDLYDKKYEWIPFGLYYELRSPLEKALTSQEYRESRDRVWRSMKLPLDKDKRIVEGNLTIASIPLEYAQALVGHSQKLIEYSLVDDAEKNLKLAIKIAPTSDTAQASLGSLYLVKRNDCKTAIPYIKKAIELKPVDKKYYFYLYTAYLGCGNKVAVEDLSRTFSKLFDQEIFNSFKNAASESGSEK